MDAKTIWRAVDYDSLLIQEWQGEGEFAVYQPESARTHFLDSFGMQLLADLHHVVDGIGREIVEGDGGDGVGVLEAEVDVGGTEAVNVKPNISRPAVFDEMFILVLVSADVADNVGGS